MPLSIINLPKHLITAGLPLKSIPKIFCLILLFLIIPLNVDAGWQFASPMPKARYGHDATLGPDGKIYVMGGMVVDIRKDGKMGRKHNNGLYSCIVYDREQHKWEFIEPVIGYKRPDYFMIFDAKMDRWREVKKVKGMENYYDILDPTNIKTYWTRLPDPIPSEKLRETNAQRQGDGVAIVTGKDGIIYWLGGNGQWLGYGEDLVIPYEPIKMKWPEVEFIRVELSPTSYTGENKIKTDIPPMLERRMEHEAVVTSNGKIYVLGGRHITKERDASGKLKREIDQDALDTVECYDPKTNKWEYRQSMTKKRFAFGAVVGPDDKIYTFGGSGDFLPNHFRETYDTTEVYDPKTDTWTTLAPMPEPRFTHVAVLGIDKKIYILGGASDIKGSPLRSVFIYDPIKDKWSRGPNMRLPRAFLAAVSTPDGKIYAIGGTDVGAYEGKERINFFLPKDSEFCTGRIQETVEVLDVLK